MTKRVNQEAGDGAIQVGDDVRGDIVIYQDPTKMIFIVGGFFVVVIALILILWPRLGNSSDEALSLQPTAINTVPSQTEEQPEVMREVTTPQVVDSDDVATPSATKAQISPTPTPTRVPVRVYQTVSIQSIANATLDFEAPATGSVTLGGVEFYVSEQIFKSQASPSCSAPLKLDTFWATLSERRASVLARTATGPRTRPG